MENLQTEHGIFTSNDVTGQTAQDVYQSWLDSKANMPKPTDKERLEALEQAMLEMVLGGM